MNTFPEPPVSPRIAVYIRKKAQPAVRQGHPWLFSDSVERVSREGAPGDVALLFDSSRKLLGAGLWDPFSPIRVRILAHGGSEPPVGPELFGKLVREAKERRAGKLPPGTTGFRLIHGESDGFPGLVADRYDTSLVFKVYSEAFLPHLGTIAAALKSEYPELERTVVRLSREIQKLPAGRGCGLADGDVIPSDGGFDGLQIFQENGLRFEADLKTGQKTGFFLDQRDNRARLEPFCAGKEVLNVFCYSGGFSLYAARGGAVSVTGIDFNKHAIAFCERNFELNRGIPSVAACRHEGIVGDAFREMDRLASEKRTFDVVIVDPPSFAKSLAEVPRALKSYAALAVSAGKLLRKNGLLVFASCSSRVTSDEFFRTVRENISRPLTELERTAHAVDHPAKFAESNYLKCLWARRRA